MIRFGVCRREQFSRNPSPIHRLLHGHRVSYQLLRTSTPATRDEIQIFDNIVYHLKLAGGAYTTTASGRLKILDVWFTENLARVFTADRALLVEDWGASGATTSADWFPVMRSRFPRVRMIASDLTVYLVEASVENDGVFVLDPDGQPLQYIAPPFVIRFPEPRSLLINQWMAARARRKLRRLSARAGIDLANLRFDHPDQEISHPPFVFRRLPLTHPRARALTATDPAFELAHHSVFTVSTRGPDVIRTVNVLNKDYFSDLRLSDAVRAVWESLTPGGVWMVGRTVAESEGIHHASILRKTESGFELLARHIEKSEVEDLALALSVPSVSTIGRS
jgi:hypothetical protein